MLQHGMSRDLFELWCMDARNGCVIPGYCVDGVRSLWPVITEHLPAGTLAANLKSEPTEITSQRGISLPVRMAINFVSFSAHADYTETSEFIEILKPPTVVRRRHAMPRHRV